MKPFNATLAKPHRRNQTLPCCFVLSDSDRLPDPMPVLERMPPGSAVILRHRDRRQLVDLANRMMPLAHKLGLKVLIAGDMRLALKTGADGVHLSERQARRGPPRIRVRKPGFLCTAAAHGPQALQRAQRAGADAALLSPLGPTASHPDADVPGFLRFLIWTRGAHLPVIALGGITPKIMRRLNTAPVYGIAAIDLWRKPAI